MKPCRLTPMGRGGGGRAFFLLHYYQACLPLGHFIKTSLVLLKNFKEPRSLMENFCNNSVQQHTSQIPLISPQSTLGTAEGVIVVLVFFYPHFIG